MAELIREAALEGVATSCRIIAVAVEEMGLRRAAPDKPLLDVHANLTSSAPRRRASSSATRAPASARSAPLPASRSRPCSAPRSTSTCT